MSRDVIDFNEQVYRTALELAEARGASEDVLQGLATMHEYTNEALEDTDMNTMGRFADLLTEGTEARSHAANILSVLQSHSFHLVMSASGYVSGQRLASNGKVTFARQLLSISVQHTGDIGLDLIGRDSGTRKETRLPCVRLLASYHNGYGVGRQYVYSLWVTAYIKVLAYNILRYNIPTSVPFMDEEG